MMMKDIEKSANLFEHEAQSRSSIVSSPVQYDLKFGLVEKSKTYDGELVLRFSVGGFDVEGKKNIFLDFTGETIFSLVVNGSVVEDVEWVAHRLFLGDLVKEGENEVAIVFRNVYDHGGDGFHQFFDPTDDEEYLYTNFEPYECHRLFPCFDQPNIRGIYNVIVSAPSKWCVLSNGKPIDASVNSETDITTHTFKETKPFSTYLFAIVVGPYDSFTSNYNDIPLGLYVRKSLTKYFDHERLFNETKAGMAFYEDFFSCPYPFGKYDQIFVPEFNAGAMENVGCVTFSEGFVHKDPPTQNQLADRSDCVLHELAHMWFGNLVTPVWWDGLWLNESFATYMAALCVAEATEYGDLSWKNFFTGMKQWAYREDQLPTTHPIQGIVPDTVSTFLNFDGITYGKGASLLKQLVYFLGIENFKQGMRYYFETYQWKNTTITQFLEALEHSDATNFEAAAWSAEWLETAGLNTLSLQMTESEGTIGDFLIIQCAPEDNPTLRHHYSEIALFDYDLDTETLNLRTTVKAEIQSERETSISSLVGEKIPDLIFINYNDHAFAKCLLDERSQQFLVSNLSKVTNSNLRQMLWSAFYTLTRDAEMKPSYYIDLFCNQILSEQDSSLVSPIISRAYTVAKSFLPSSQREEVCDRLFNLTYNQIEGAEGDFLITWAKYAVFFANSKKNVETLVQDLKADRECFTQRSRWEIIVNAHCWHLEGCEELAEIEKERDPSDVGTKAILRAKASIPTLENKEAHWQMIHDKESTYSLHELGSVMSGIFWEHQQDITKPYTEKFFDAVETVFDERKLEFAKTYMSLFPDEPEQEWVHTKAVALLNSLDESKTALKNSLKKKIDDLERSIRTIAKENE